MWSLLLNDEQQMIADSVRDYLERELPVGRFRPNAASLNLNWVRAEQAELGWFGLGLPESVGGSGLGLLEEALVQREGGRNLMSPSMMGAVLAGHVAAAAGDVALAKAFASGEASAAMTIAASPADPALAYALDWTAEDRLIAWNDEGMGLFDPASFADATADVCLDESISLHTGRLDFGSAAHWVPTSQAPLALRAEVLLAAALAGLAERACEMAVDYAKVRQQFAKPIGSFQAVKHRCADMGVRWRLAWYQTHFASLKVQEGEPDARLQAHSAKMVAGNAGHENGRAAIQVHGGIGFQSECDIHWFMKRAHVYDQLGGPVAVQARRVAAEPSPMAQRVAH